ncbi:MAG: SpoIID/LytB domain-containing protein [Candidatus Scalinduaceae bacterium]
MTEIKRRIYKLLVNKISLKHKYAIAVIVLLIVSLFISLSCFTINKRDEFVYYKYLNKPPDIRVLLLKDAEKAKIEINTSYSISDMDNHTVFAQGLKLPKSNIYMNSGKLWIKPESYLPRNEASNSLIKANSSIKLSSHNNGFIKLNNSKYQGKLLIIPQKSGKFSVLEEINLEDYLPGVVESEVPSRWQYDAILAQVIAARSYAIFQKRTNNNSQYHVGKLDLAYNGSYTKQSRIKDIVDGSRGVVMLYKWKFFPGYFHSTCGGYTEDINLVFGLKNITPLGGVSCGYCEKSKYYQWKKEIKKSEIEKKLHDNKVNIKNIYDVAAEKIGKGGHCATIKIKHSQGVKRFNANEFRLMVGPNNLRSTAFKVKNNGDSLIFEGKGWGHGVGLCQYGMQDMAKSGFKWYEILKYYYPGVELVKVY